MLWKFNDCEENPEVKTGSGNEIMGGSNNPDWIEDEFGILEGELIGVVVVVVGKNILLSESINW